MTTPITFNDVQRYCEQSTPIVKPLVDELDRIVVSGRDRDGVPLAWLAASLAFAGTLVGFVVERGTVKSPRAGRPNPSKRARSAGSLRL